MRKLLSAERDFPRKLQELLASRESAVDVRAPVATILADMRTRKDEALLEYTARLDRFSAEDASQLRVLPQEIANAVSLCTPEVIRSLRVAAERIADYSRRQLPRGEEYLDATGVALGWQWTPLDSVGLYVPGGKASYPSSVLMNAVVARVAGVSRLVMCVPAPDGHLNPAVLAAAHVAGVEEIWKIGGAQAVAALAYGTESIAAVDKIVGPGNAYVAEAKRQVFGHVGIDMIAGPSEVVVLADATARADWIAADLLSQAEHDEQAQAILITSHRPLLEAVAHEIEQQLAALPRADVARASWKNHGAMILVRDMEDALEVSNIIAPEHLELCVDDPGKYLAGIRHAGAIFAGHHTPEAMGDYLAGPSHVLPTGRTARFASGLSVFDFLKRTSLIGFTPAALANLGHYAEVLAVTEGLNAHANSITRRVTVPA